MMRPTRFPVHYNVPERRGKLIIRIIGHSRCFRFRLQWSEHAFSVSSQFDSGSRFKNAVVTSKLNWVSLNGQIAWISRIELFLVPSHARPVHIHHFCYLLTGLMALFEGGKASPLCRQTKLETALNPYLLRSLCLNL